jgi:peroxiredoxin
MEKLNKELESYRQEHQPAPEIGQKLREAIERVEASGQATGLSVGDRAPNFELRAADGATVTLYDRLADGPVVLVFYRGEWCPYCNLELRYYQRALPDLRNIGADVIAITPQAPDRSIQAIERHGIDFPVLSDEDFQVIEQYGLTIDVEGEYREVMEQGFGRDLGELNADGTWRLPAPGTYVIDRDGTVVAAYASPRYWTRMEPHEVLEALRSLATGSAAEI